MSKAVKKYKFKLYDKQNGTCYCIYSNRRLSMKQKLRLVRNYQVAYPQGYDYSRQILIIDDID